MSEQGNPQRISRRDRDTILKSLSAGVVPSRGQQHIQVGRADEIEALIGDIERIRDDGACVRFIIGRYGSGKTFFLHLVRSIAMQRGLVTMHADLAPDRRLQASGGQAQNLYQELARNLATRSSPAGGAMESVVERFITTAMQQARSADTSASVVISERLHHISQSVGGYDFATVVDAYWRAHSEGDDHLRACAVRWLRGEYTTKVDARRDLGVRTFVDDQSVYDHLKIFAEFVVLAGYEGLIVCLDEMVNLFKISHTQSRTSNYEQILRIVNDTLQGHVGRIGFVFGGTPEFLTDPRRGLYSYEALSTRLQENAFARDGLKDLSGPVIRLPSLSQEELFVLLGKLRHVHAGGEEEQYLVDDSALKAFMRHCFDRIGAHYFQTPRNTIKSFVQLLAVLEQNPVTTWQALLEDHTISIEPDREPSTDTNANDSPSSGNTGSRRMEPEDDKDDLARFRI